MVSKKSNVTVDSKHQEKMNEFQNIAEVIIPKLKKQKQKYKKQLNKKNITLDKKLGGIKQIRIPTRDSEIHEVFHLYMFQVVNREALKHMNRKKRTIY